MSSNWRLPLWYWLLIPGFFLLVQLFFGTPRLSSLPYSDFKRLLHAGKLVEVRIAEDRIEGTLNADGLESVLPTQQVEQMRCTPVLGCPFTTARVDDPALPAELERAGVRYAGETASGWPGAVLSWIFPLLLLFWLWGSLARKGGASGWLFNVGKSRARIYVRTGTDVRFEDVAGIDEAKTELMEIVDFLKQPQRYRRLGARIPKGVLIVGAPGTGKTLLAKAVAGEAGVPFFSISGSEFVEMFVGVGAARVRDLFAQAEEKAPCIIFIDELDALGRARGVAGMVGSYNEQEQTLNQLLVEMDGFDPNKGVIILAATNRPEILDPALLRPGRFDRHIALDRPDLRGREKILGVHVKRLALGPDIDLAAIAARTAGLAGADLANLANEAALLAARRGKERVDMADFDEATDRQIAGVEKKTRIMNPEEKKTVAYHEAGHALVAECRPHADRVAKISIIPRGIAALGYTQQQPTEDRYLLKKSELLDRMDVLLGGRVAEELAFGDLSTGAQNDLQLATDMARHMVTQYGMSDALGLASFEPAAAPVPYRFPAADSRGYSERTAQTIDAEIQRLLGEAHARVTETLKEKRLLLDALAQVLLEKETLDRPALEALLKGRAAAPARRSPEAA